MAIICDTCKVDVTPNDLEVSSEISGHEIVNINGKICLCIDCLMCLGEFVRSDKFNKIREDYDKQCENEGK